MVMIGLDDLDEAKELDERLQALFQALIQNRKATDADRHSWRQFLDWLIYEDWETHTKELDIRPIQWSDGLAPAHRDLLIGVARAAAELVKSGKDRDKSALVQACEELLRDRGVAFGEQIDGQQPQRVDRQTDARDKFIYQKVCKGSRPEQVLALIDQHPDWESLTEREVFDCALRYSQRHGLPLPPQE
jgi:hypothetical protein